MVRLLLDTNLPSNSPQINTCLGLGTHLNLDMGNGDDDSKRRRLILLLHIRLLAYESALFKRDIAILLKEAYHDTHFKVRHIVKECASQLGLKGKPLPQYLNWYINFSISSRDSPRTAQSNT